MLFYLSIYIIAQYYNVLLGNEVILLYKGLEFDRKLVKH